MVCKKPAKGTAKQKSQKQRGRPQTYTKEIFDDICARVSRGESLRSIIKDDHMPEDITFYRWLREHNDLSVQYARAKEDRADTLADELTEIADNGKNDWMEKNDPDNPGYAVNGENVQRSRLRIETRKWIASKLHPRNYGDRQNIELTGKDGGGVKVDFDVEKIKALKDLLK